jgi:hypothetical protein
MKRTLLAVSIAVLASLMWILGYQPCDFTFPERHRASIFALDNFHINLGANHRDVLGSPEAVWGGA